MKEKFPYEDGSKFEEPIQFQISKDISNTSQYYQADNYEKFVSLDLDNNDHNNYLFQNNIFEKLGVEKQFFSSLIELIEEVKVEKTFQKPHLEPIWSQLKAKWAHLMPNPKIPPSWTKLVPS